MRLGEYTEILRSKNAGPFCQTVDLVYKNVEKYNKVKESNVLTPEKISSLYNVPIEDVEINFFDAACSVKVAFPRKHSCGSYYDTDCYGAQQHMPIADLEIEV